MAKKRSQKNDRTRTKSKPDSRKSGSDAKESRAEKDYDFGGIREMSGSEIMGLVSTLFVSGKAFAGAACKY